MSGEFGEVFESDDDNKWPRKTIGGVEYVINPLDESVLLDPKDGNAVGCLKEDGTIEPLDDDDDWPTRTINGIEYLYNESDGLLICQSTAEYLGYLKEDGTVDYIQKKKTHEQLDKEAKKLKLNS